MTDAEMLTEDETDESPPVDEREMLEPFIQEAARSTASPRSREAVIQTESRFNPLAAVAAWARRGSCSSCRKTAAHVGIENPFDPRENILGGTKYLSRCCSGSRATRPGPSPPTTRGRRTWRAIAACRRYRETQGYVRKIQKIWSEDTDAEFSIPLGAGQGAARVSARSTRSAARKASMSSRARRRSAPATKATAKRASARSRSVGRRSGRRT